MNLANITIKVYFVVVCLFFFSYKCSGRCSLSFFIDYVQFFPHVFILRRGDIQTICETLLLSLGLVISCSQIHGTRTGCFAQILAKCLGTSRVMCDKSSVTLSGCTPSSALPPLYLNRCGDCKILSPPQFNNGVKNTTFTLIFCLVFSLLNDLPILLGETLCSFC